jgi:hypothetical protein
VQNKQDLIKTIELEEAILGLRHDGIYHVYYKANTIIDVPLQEKLRGVLKEMTQNKKSLFLFEAGDYCSVTKEARDNAIKTETDFPSSATVVLVQNLAYKMIADFYYKINKPKQPYKVVRRFDEGIKWLLSFADTENSEFKIK